MFDADAPTGICGHEFCYRCLADYGPIHDRGNHMHNAGCRWYAGSESNPDTHVMMPPEFANVGLQEALAAMGNLQQRLPPPPPHPRQQRVGPRPEQPLRLRQPDFGAIRRRRDRTARLDALQRSLERPLNPFTAQYDPELQQIRQRLERERVPEPIDLTQDDSDDDSVIEVIDLTRNEDAVRRGSPAQRAVPSPAQRPVPPPRRAPPARRVRFEEGLPPSPEAPPPPAAAPQPPPRPVATPQPRPLPVAAPDPPPRPVFAPVAMPRRAPLPAAAEQQQEHSSQRTVEGAGREGEAEEERRERRRRQLMRDYEMFGAVPSQEELDRL